MLRAVAQLASVAALLGFVAAESGCARPREPQRPPPSPRAARDAEIAQGLEDFVLDTANRRTCAWLRNRFIGIPGVTPGPGTPAMIGRFWIRDCRTFVDRHTLTADVRGPLWTFVDQRNFGSDLDDDVAFWADVRLEGTLDARYARDARLASLWFNLVRAPHVGPVRVLERGRAPGLLFPGAIVLGRPTDGASAESRTAIELERGMPPRLAAIVEHGVTIVYDVESGTTTGALERLRSGRFPTRPFPDREPTLMNERQTLHPSALGFQVAGPFDPAARARLDVVLESGGSIDYRTACEDDVVRGISPIEHHGVPSVPLAARGVSGDVSTRLASIDFVPPRCRWYLVTKAGGETTTASIRLRELP